MACGRRRADRTRPRRPLPARAPRRHRRVRGRVPGRRRRLQRRVAVKILHPALADDPTFLKRFRAEAQAAAALNHPNIMAVYDWGEERGTPYLVTEYLSGGSLRTMLDRDRLLVAVAGAAGRPRGGPGPRLRPPPGLRPPRHQAGQPAVRRRRPAAHRRLRAGPRPRRGGLDRAGRRRAGHRPLRLARAGQGHRRRRQERRVLAGPRAGRVGHRHGAVRGRHHRRHAHEPASTS